MFVNQVSKVAFLAAAGAAVLSSCSGGGGGGGGSSTPTPTPTSTPTGISFSISGTANKGLILGGDVQVFDLSAPNSVLTSAVTSSVNSNYTLNLSGVKGQFVKVVVTGGSGATMVCDAPSGCGPTAFGETIAIGADFEMSAILKVPANGGSLTAHINPLTTLASGLAEKNAGTGQMQESILKAAYNKVADQFGFDSSDFWSLPAIDITRPSTGTEPSANALKAAYVCAGLLDAMFEASGTPGERFRSITNDFVTHDGQLVIKEQNDLPDLISIEDVFEGAFHATSVSPRTGANKDAATDELEAVFLAVFASPWGGRSSQLPQRPVLSTTEAIFNFGGVVGQAVEAGTLHVVGDGIPWTISDYPYWLEFSPLSGTGDVSVSLQPNTNRASIGTHSSRVSVRDQETPKEVSVNVDFTIGDVLTTSAEEPLIFTTVSGNVFSQSQTLNLIGQNVDWEAGSDQDWATVDMNSGTSPSEINVQVDPTGLEPGIHTAYMTFSDVDFDQEASVRVDLKVEPRRINVSETGVAFSEFPSSSILRREIQITDSLGESASWWAVQTDNWVQITTSGTTDDPLIIEVDPTGLAYDTVHLATVTVRSHDETIENTEMINVSVWRSETDPEPRVEIQAPARYIASDPVFPYVYTNTGGRDVDVYNVYTGDHVGTMDWVGETLGVMSSNPDGTYLYVTDTSDFRIVDISLSDWLARGMLDAQELDSLSASRVDGRQILFSGAGQAFDLTTGLRLAEGYVSEFYSYSNAVSVSRNGKTMCLLERGLGPYMIRCNDLEFSHLDGGTLTISNSRSTRHENGANGRDLAVSNDGKRAYVSSSYPYEFTVFDTETLEIIQILPGTNYPNAAEIGPKDNFVGGVDGYYADKDVWTYAPDGTEIQSYNLSGGYNSLHDQQLAISGDGSRIIGATTDGYVVILSLH